MGKQVTPSKPAARFFFGVYCALMLWLLFGQRLGGAMSDGSYLEQIAANINYIPMRTVRLFLRALRFSQNPDLIRQSIINLAGNVVMFMPLGFFLPCIWPKLRPFFKTLLTVASVIIAVEVIQLFTLLGSCDVDDLILNVIGAVVGYCGWSLTVKRR